ncbi:CDIF630_02480 family spore surface protein [Cellulosilyticum ruminicola]|uniref:CDIF630_02480 family spore surface protein n=1 Tax=Cellulosilyticum ruminicola TaxID=425254 RepID=UPI0006D13D98|nr:DUF3787 domain-containing protein [Cellulosilyticum ruminicola]
MEDTKSQTVDGRDNYRLDNTDIMIDERTAAWANKENEFPKTHVSIPDIESVINAKEWVDSGSKL